MHTTNLRKVGGSVMLAVPPALLDVLRLRAGAKVGVTVQSGRLVVEPRPRPRYTLDELLAQCDPKARRSKEDREWTRGKRAGAELI
jgi:antitoxin ChpS